MKDKPIRYMSNALSKMNQLLAQETGTAGGLSLKAVLDFIDDVQP